MPDDLGEIAELGGAAALEMVASALSGRGADPGKCPNCDAPMIGAYCAVCGQERDTHRRSVMGLAHDLIQDVSSFDSRILRTARALLFQPGELPCAFREGRTRRYMPALRLYFFVSLIFFLMLGVSGIAILQLQVVAKPQTVVRDAQGNAFIANPAYDPADSDLKYIPKLIPVPKEKADLPGGLHSFSTEPYFFRPTLSRGSALTPALRNQLAADEALVQIQIERHEKGEKAKQIAGVGAWVKQHVYGGIQRLAADPAALNEPMTTWIPRVLFLLLPLYALLLATFYWRQRKKYYLVDHLIFSLSMHTFTFVALIAAAGLAQIVSGETVFWFLLGSIGLYVFLSLRRFYQQSWFWTGVKFFCISGIYTVFFLLPALIGIVSYGFLYS